MEEDKHDAFTAYDIWCAGLSSDTSRDVGGDLRRPCFCGSPQPLDGFEMKEVNNKYRNEATDQARRGWWRRH